MDTQRLIQLADAYLSDESSPEDFAELEQAIVDDPEARELFWDRVQWHTSIREFCKRRAGVEYAKELAGAEGNPGADARRLVERIATDDLESHKTESDDQEHVKSPVLGFLGGVVDYVNHSRRLMFLLIAVALCGWFVFQIGSVLLGRWWAGNGQVADRGGDRAAVPGAGQKHDDGSAGGSGRLHGNALAWLSGSVGGRWQIVNANPAAGAPAAGSSTGNPAGGVFWEIGTEFPAGQQVKLVAGLGEITFRSGAKVVVSAPALFSVTSALRTDLQLGKLTARVPHDSSNNGRSQNGPSQQGATGFTVNTPAGSVVDLGTEFGVEVTPDHRLDVQVFVGEVAINSPAADGSGAGGEPAVHVAAGKTAHVEPGKRATVVESNEKTRFQRDLTIASDSSDRQMSAYLDFVRQLKPVAWLRMEGKEGDRSLHDDAGAVDGKLFWDGPGNPFVEGRVGKGLWLRGEQLRDYAIVPDYPKAEHGKLTVAAWVFADSRPFDATLVSNWGGGPTNGQFRFGLYGQDKKGSGIAFCAYVAQADGSHAFAHEGESHAFPVNQWQHVAFTTDGTTLRLYRQGRLVGLVKHSGIQFPVEQKPLAIGVQMNPAGDSPSQTPHFWSGKLDEIAVFNESLTPEQIQKLAAAPPR